MRRILHADLVRLACIAIDVIESLRVSGSIGIRVVPVAGAAITCAPSLARFSSAATIQMTINPLVLQDVHSAVVMCHLVRILIRQLGDADMTSSPDRSARLTEKMPEMQIKV
jgi:hypothetical protein